MIPFSHKNAILLESIAIISHMIILNSVAILVLKQKTKFLRITMKLIASNSLHHKTKIEFSKFFQISYTCYNVSEIYNYSIALKFGIMVEC
jgi:hypothetical protein